MDAGRYAGQDGDYGKSVSQRMTPKNQHGTSGPVEHVAKQPNLRGSNAG
jgi:hypothetical protein